METDKEITAMKSQEIRVPGGIARTKLSEVTKIIDTEEGFGKKTITTGPFYCAGGGHQLKIEASVRCSHCNALVCDSCSIKYGPRSQEHCEKCFRREHYDVSLSDYLFLMCVDQGLNNLREISNVSRIPERELEEKYEGLEGYLMMESSFMSLKVGVNHRGRDALNVYETMYGKDPLVVELKEELRRWAIRRK